MDNQYPIADPFSEIYGNTAIDNIVGKDKVINTEVKRMKGLVSKPSPSSYFTSDRCKRSEQGSV